MKWELTVQCFKLANSPLLTSVSYRNCEELNAYLQLQNVYVPGTEYLALRVILMPQRQETINDGEGILHTTLHMLFRNTTIA